jgi:hypothetical protein
MNGPHQIDFRLRFGVFIVGIAYIMLFITGIKLNIKFYTNLNKEIWVNTVKI